MGATLAESPGGRINPKWAWHHHALLTLRERLLRDQREQLADAAQPLEPHSLNYADSATDEFDHNLALAALAMKQDALREIDAAISRIHSGSYGVCEETGKPIPAARLKAIPWTRFTREVEARHETERGRRPPHLGALGSVRGTPTGNLEPMKSVEAAEEEERPATDEALRNDQIVRFGADPRAGKPWRP
jgi:RNA polymerase-binding transcription factor DksA